MMPTNVNCVHFLYAVDDANTEYLNEMRYETIDQWSGYKRGECFILYEKMDLILSNFKTLWYLRRSAEDRI